VSCFFAFGGKIKVKGRNVQVLFCPFHIIWYNYWVITQKALRRFYNWGID